MTYDYRVANETDENNERLEDLSGMAGDAVLEAERLLGELDKRTDSDALNAPKKLADDILADLQTAESAEKMQDFVGCVRDVRKNMTLLAEALKKAKRSAKSDEDATAVEAVEEAEDCLRSLNRELKGVEREMEDEG